MASFASLRSFFPAFWWSFDGPLGPTAKRSCPRLAAGLRWSTRISRSPGFPADFTLLFPSARNPWVFCLPARLSTGSGFPGGWPWGLLHLLFAAALRELKRWAGLAPP